MMHILNIGAKFNVLKNLKMDFERIFKMSDNLTKDFKVVSNWTEPKSVTH